MDSSHTVSPSPPPSIGSDTVTANHMCSDEKDPSSHIEAPSFPEGGLGAWKTVAGAFLIQICGFGYTTSYGVYQDYYVRTYLTDKTASSIAWIGSVNTLLVMCGGLVSGRLYDRGYFYWLLGGGSFLTAFALFMLSLCQKDHYEQIFLAHGICHGLAAGTLYIPSIAIISHYFNERRHVAMTIVTGGAAIGSIVHPLMINNLLKSGFTFGATTRISAAFVSFCLLLACGLMRTRLEPMKSTASFRRAIIGGLTDPLYMLSVFGFWAFIMGFYFPLFYIQLDAVKHGINEHFAFYSISILNASSFFGRMGSGFVAHKLGVVSLIAFSTLSCALVILGMIGLSNIPSVVLIAVFYGLFSGVVLSLVAPMFALLTDDMSQLGVRMGLSFALASSAGLIGPPVQGALLTSNYDWWKPAVFSGTIGIIGFFIFVLVIIGMKRRRQTKVIEDPEDGKQR
ncbi:MFS general substrate transporter [Flagelloscypha sp. PMI_526]|nr:MFS general substrate transporter [Flagelloscypha sp. PMI_526]